MKERNRPAAKKDIYREKIFKSCVRVLLVQSGQKKVLKGYLLGDVILEMPPGKVDGQV